MALGKWILGGLGWSIAGPLGGIIGFFVGKSFEHTNDGNGRTHREGPYGSSGTTTQGDLMVSLLVLVAAVMKADGQVKQSELNYVKDFLRKNFSEEKSLELLRLLRDILKQDISVDEVCRQIRVNTDYDTRYHLVDFLVGLAAADSELAPAEERLLDHIRRSLGIAPGDYLSMCARYGFGYGHGQSYSQSYSHPQKDPYKVLGLDPTATDDEVKKAYRRLAMKYHPDKVEHLGEELKRNAEAQFREINEAYEAIKAARGMK